MGQHGQSWCGRGGSGKEERVPFHRGWFWQRRNSLGWGSGGNGMLGLELAG